MSGYLCKSFLMLAAMVGCMTTARESNACHGYYTVANCAAPTATVAIYAGETVAYAAVQQTPQYDLRRAEVPSGSRLTLFANFLGQQQGIVMFEMNGTSAQCQVVGWKPQSVTIELPKLGLVEPKNAVIVIVLPDGRIAKNFRVLFVAQPDVVVHRESVPQPLPPAPASAPAAYAVPGASGL